jgi:2-C-methyl-D-erythritol 4-phosphate cytidylyltransferase
LGGEPLLRLTVDKFLVCPRIDHIIVAAPAIWMSHTRDLLRDKRFADVSVCEGGHTRQESLYQAVNHIESVFPVADDDIVVSHDVARPFVSLRVIEENIDALQEYDAANTVLPATDTIVESDDQRTVARIQDRKRMYQGQTPQTFRRTAYLRLYEQLERTYLDNVTDAARILAEHGCTVALVRGDEFNIKITTEYDFHIASFLLDAAHD